MKTRLDQYLVNIKICKSKAQAQDLIKRGEVLLDGEKILKPARSVNLNSKVEVLTKNPFVSRGGLKLEHALNTFQIEVKNLIALDVGASTGGFTDCLLKAGIKQIFAVDIGTLQLAPELKNDPRVTSMEQTDIRSIKKLPLPIDLAVIDLSYISLRLILANVQKLVKKNGQIIALFKPQFEGGPESTNKRGVILEEATHQKIFTEFKNWCKKENITIEQETMSPITGKKGNHEYLILIKN